MKAFIHSISLNRLIAMLLSAALLSWAGVVNAAEFDQTYAGYDGLLKTYVTDGRADYKGLKTDPNALDRYIDSAAGVPEEQFNSWTQSQRLAFLINLYNAATLKLVVDHYPVKSIKDIGSLFKGPWDQPVVRLYGKTITLNHLEHDILRKQYSEPRIHMALVCAAKSCPQLRSEAYTTEKLDEQLNDQSRQYLVSPAGLNVDRKKKVVYFSSIFKWYGEDFVAKYSPTTGFAGLDKTERAVANFCSAYLISADREFLATGGYSVKYLDYDWSLNEK
ncbi:MAG: DUF547 domain-containing protein [Desulfobacterales bacterium]